MTVSGRTGPGVVVGLAHEPCAHGITLQIPDGPPTYTLRILGALLDLTPIISGKIHSFSSDQ